MLLSLLICHFNNTTNVITQKCASVNLALKKHIHEPNKAYNEKQRACYDAIIVLYCQALWSYYQHSAQTM